MKPRDMISMALGNLFRRKARTVLTVSGVVIGTCAIVVMLSLGFGMRQSMEDTMKQMGDLTVLTVYTGGGKGASDSSSALDDRALKKIRAIPNVVALTPVFPLDPSVVTVSCRKYRFQGMIYGVEMEALEALGYQTESGALPKEGAGKTAVLFGSFSAYDFVDPTKKDGGWIDRRPDKNGKLPDPYVDLAEDRFQLKVNPPEGSTARVKAEKLTVAGVLKEDYSKNPNSSDSLFLDVTYAKELKAKYDKLNNIKAGSAAEGYNMASVKVASVEAVSDAEQAVQDLGFQVYSMKSMREPMENQLRTIQMILGGLGAISLLVAALGITNTMIMSIYERTREIGIMKVLGCAVRNIRFMFLTEAGAIGFLGGAAGIGVSWGISALINFIAASRAGGGLLGMGGRISIIPPWLAAGALGFATLVGLVSGLYPANRAVRVSALTAIRQTE